MVYNGRKGWQAHKLATIGLIGAIFSIIFFVISFFVDDNNWLGVFLGMSVLLAIISVLLSGLSISIQNSKRGIAALVLGIMMLLLFGTLAFMLRDLCVVC